MTASERIRAARDRAQQEAIDRHRRLHNAEIARMEEAAIPECVVCDDAGCSYCPAVPRTLPLFNLKGDEVAEALVSNEDYAALAGFPWYLASTGYAKTGNEYMHRMVMGLVSGDGLEVDHLNHITLDNRRENLRVVTHAENHKNRKLHARNTTGYPGVWQKRGKRFVAQTAVGGKTIYIGTYDTAEEAHEARQAFIANPPEPWPAETFALLGVVDLEQLARDIDEELERRAGL